MAVRSYTEHKKVTWKIPEVKIWNYTTRNRARDIYIQLVEPIEPSTSHSDTFISLSNRHNSNHRTYYLRSDNTLQFPGKLHVKIIYYKKG